MIYLDSGATSFHKPPQVQRAVINAMNNCASPGRGGYAQAINAGQVVYQCREKAGELFDCESDRVAFTTSCTHSLNIAIRSLVKPGARVVISGFEHNAVTRPLYAINADIIVAGRRLFDWEDMLEKFEIAMKNGAEVAVFTHCSNVFGYVLPVDEMAKICKKYAVPFIVDAAQSAGILPVKLKSWGADFIAMPGHKGLLGPQGTGLLLCKAMPVPLLYGGTGSRSIAQDMPNFLPDRVEAGTLNVPGIAGLSAGLSYLKKRGIVNIEKAESSCAKLCGRALEAWGFRTFLGEAQTGTVSFVPNIDAEEAAGILARRGVAVRAGLHCAPLAHESAGTLETGTVRISFGYDATKMQALQAISILEKLKNSL